MKKKESDYDAALKAYLSREMERQNNGLRLMAHQKIKDVKSN